MKKQHSRSLRSSLTKTLMLLALVLRASVALADDGPSEHAKKARVAYDLQDFGLAIKEFRAAYVAEQRPEYLFGLAQAQRQAKDYAGAIASFKSYKRLEGITAQQGTAAELLITKCEVDQARADAEASSRADRSNVTEEPLAKPAAAPEVGSTLSTPAPVPGPSKREEAASAARRDDARPGARHFYSDALGDSLFIAGLGASGVGGFLLITGNSDMKASRDMGTDSAAQRAADSAHGKQVTGAVLLPIGGALLVGGIIRWATNSSSEASNTSGLVVGPQYVGYSGQF